MLLQTLLDQLPEGIAIAYGPPDFPIIALRGPLSPIRNAVQLLKLMASGEPKLHQLGDIIDQ